MDKREINRGRVLVVEDDPILRDWIVYHCDIFKAEVEMAGNLEEASHLIMERSYHAVITDIYLNEERIPEGLDVVSKANAKGLPVIAMTGHLHSEVAKEATNRGALYLLEKPFTSKQLKIALDNIWDEPRGLHGIAERFFDEHRLSDTEKIIAELLLKGLSSLEIAQLRSVSIKTVKTHISNIFSKCAVKSRAELFNSVIPM